MVVKGKFDKTSKSPKILWRWLSEKFYFAFYVSQNLVRIYLSFWKNILHQTCKSFNTKLGPQWKDPKSSFQVRQILALFCDLVALNLG